MALTKIGTDGIKDDAVTSGKIPANAVGSSELADNAVDTAAIADQAVALSKLPHGDGSSDGKFLRANNGADPSFETVSIPAGTTINNQGDNRVITGDASANTLNGESNVTIDSSGRLLLGTTTEGFSTADDLTIATSTDTGITIRSGTSNQGNIFFADGTSGDAEYRGIIQYTHGSGTGEHLRLFVNAAEKVRIDSDGLKLNGDTAAANALSDYEEGSWTPAPENLSNSPTYYNLQGKYTKVGRLVTIWGMIQVGATQPTFSSNTLDLRIAGLPFANDDTTGYIGGAGATTYQSFNVYGSTYNNYGAEGNVVCGTANSTRIVFNVNPHQNNGIRGTVRRKALEGTGPILTWTMQYQTTA